MTVGTSSWDGLGMGLHGEYDLTQVALATDIFTISGVSGQTGDYFVCRNSDGTERIWINSDGCIYSRGATVTSTAYLGLDARGTVGAGGTGTWYCTIGGRMTTSMVNAEGAQVYALYGAIYDTGGVTGGRMHCLGLYFSTTSPVAGGGACSWIYFVQASSPIPYLYTIGGVTLDESGGCFITSNQTASRGLAIDVGGTTYYILLGAAS